MRGLLRAQPDDIAEDEGSALPRRESLERRDVRELDRLELLVATRRIGRVWVEPGLLVVAAAHVDISGGGTELGGRDAFRTPLGHADAGMRGDAEEPRARGAAALEAGEAAPCVEQGLLKRIVGVG